MITVTLFYSCTVEEDDVSLPVAPTASFTAVPSGDNPNVIILTNTSENGGLAVYDFEGSDKIATSEPVMASFPFTGTYTITMTAIGAGGTDVTELTVTIDQNDPNAISVTQRMLVGDPTNPKLWRVSRSAGDFGVGPGSRLEDGTLNPSDPEDQAWFSAGENAFDGGGGCVYEDSYQFSVTGLNTGTMIHDDPDGMIWWNWTWANGLLGASQGEFADVCFPTDQPGSIQYEITSRVGADDVERNTLELTEGAKIAYYEGVSNFQIVSISDTELRLRFGNGDFNAGATANGAESGGGWRYLVLVSE